MTDIVERLRAGLREEKELIGLDIREAADEIEQLRKEIKWLRKELDYFGFPKTDYKR